MKLQILKNKRTGKIEYFRDGKQISEKEWQAGCRGIEPGSPCNTPLPGNWPRTSQAAGVMPSQAAEAARHASECGVPTEFNREGDPVFTSPSHEKKYLRKVMKSATGQEWVNKS
jgi:hypothetical protein